MSCRKDRAIWEIRGKGAEKECQSTMPSATIPATPSQVRLPLQVVSLYHWPRSKEDWPVYVAIGDYVTQGSPRERLAAARALGADGVELRFGPQDAERH